MKKNIRFASFKTLSLIAGLAAAVLFGSPQSPSRSQAADEPGLLAILRSKASLQEKDAACAALKRLGTARSVPVLAGLLADPDLSHTARFALESMPVPEAGAALIEALDKTGGLIKIGIIHSLGRRREMRAVPPLGRLLDDPDPNVARTAALSLGRIAGPQAVRILHASISGAGRDERRMWSLDALLAAADQERAAGRGDAASSIYEMLLTMPTPAHVRVAAYRGAIVAAKAGRAVELVKIALRGGDPSAQTAALETAREIPNPEMTRALGGALASASPALKIALIEALRQRGDPAGAPLLLAQLPNGDREVRVAAIGALGDIGDDKAVGVLLDASSSQSEEEAKAARTALLVLRRGGVTRALMARLNSGDPAARANAARALSGRGNHDAAPGLIDAARLNTDPARGAMFQALGQLAVEADLTALVQLIKDSKEEGARAEAGDALSAACLRLRSRGVRVDPSPIVAALGAADVSARAALLKAASGLADERVRAALRGAMNDPDPVLREAAARAITGTLDAALLPDLLGLAGRAEDAGLRARAVQGYVRLALDAENSPLQPIERVGVLKKILPWARPEERWALLSGLAGIPEPASLEAVLSMLDDPATRAEAAQAAIQIASTLPAARRELSRVALEKVLAAVSDPAQKEAALAALRRIDPRAEPSSPISFRRVRLDGAFRSEGVAVADFNRDGHLDIATGNILYLGPDWKAQPMLAAAKEFNPENYSDSFLCFAEDIDRDGWTDLIVVGFPGAGTRWLRNPGKAGGPWEEFLAIEKTGNESPAWIDVDNDGHKELVFVSEKGMAFARPGADPKKPWPIKVIAGPADPKPAHGLGVGDINADGRLDIVCPQGWWEGPKNPAQVPWKFHPAKLAEEDPAQMLVLDLNGDGRPDVVSSAAHRYGLWWYEQTATGWIPHEIDRSISQLHALHMADLNGDGLPDLVTGKRFWAHREGDEGIDDPAVLCWYEMRRENGGPSWIRHDIDFDSGVGLHFQIVDLNGDGLLDLVTSNKKGVYVFFQQKK
ncbi:MAG: HEAT repeat domain-containing protein [Candidatus Aminicenantales bacterium]|jgi:HEAT repeat protein